MVKIFKPEPHLLFEKSRIFQLAHEFKSLTVRENLMVVPHNQAGENLLKVWFSRNLVKESEKKVSKKADEVIEFLEISSLADELAGNLSGGQKILELGRTMMVEPKIVFLMRLESVEMGRSIKLPIVYSDYFEFGYTFCLIEHDMDFISRLCDPVICMAEVLFWQRERLMKSKITNVLLKLIWEQSGVRERLSHDILQQRHDCGIWISGYNT